MGHGNPTEGREFLARVGFTPQPLAGTASRRGFFGTLLLVAGNGQGIHGLKSGISDLMKNAQIDVPRLVRMKAGALQRLGLYLARSRLTPAALLHSEAMLPSILDTARQSLRDYGIAPALVCEVKEASVEEAARLRSAVPSSCKALIGVGGGKALDIAKYTASLAELPYFAVPTSLSNDGFCSPQASLTSGGKRQSVSTGPPEAIVVDLAVCQQAPRPLWHSGVGDLCSKFTAVSDWKLAFYRRGDPVNDLAALISDASVFQFMANPVSDREGIRLLATALMLNGVAMEIAGSSRPASGSEHLISHALDMIEASPRLHGLQTGTAAYLVSSLQHGNHHEKIGELFARTGFWESVRKQPFSKEEWRIAVERAPSVKEDFYTILSERDAWPEFARMIAHDPALVGCFE